MADLGTIATLQSVGDNGLLNQSQAPVQHVDAKDLGLSNSFWFSGWAGNLKAIRLGSPDAFPDLLPFAGRSDTEGSPGAPCLWQRVDGAPRFRWLVIPGTQQLWIGVKQAANLSPRPQVIARANPAIGVNADVAVAAGSSAGWITIGPVTVTPTAKGALWVELQNRVAGWYDCFWDNLLVSGGRANGFDSWLDGAPVLDPGWTAPSPSPPVLTARRRGTTSLIEQFPPVG